MTTMTDSAIREFIDAMDSDKDAKYSEYHSKILSDYNGCSDSRYSEIFLRKLWDRLIDIVYSQFRDYDLVNVLTVNSIGAKALKFMPKNSMVTALNNDFYCSIASKAILQNIKLDIPPTIEFGSIANYFCFPDKFNIAGKQLVITSYETDSEYYKVVDVDKKLTELPYYLYSFVRGTEFLSKNAYICVIVPNNLLRTVKEFNLSAYSDVKLT